MGFAVIIKLILVGIMLFSVISYMLRRAGNKQNLKHIINNNQPTRQLTDEEFALLKPYLDDKNLVKPYKYQSELVSRDVTVIGGECIRHSTSSNGTETSHYFAIGGIEVFMPYGMENYTMADNVAEVVFTKQYAFVVNLNGYTLFTAKSDRDLDAKLDDQWHQGSSGQFKKLSDEELEQLKQAEYSSDIEPIIQQAANRRCEIISQRDETPLEASQRSQLNTGFLSGLFLIIAFIFAFNYEDGDLWILITSSVCILLSILFYIKKTKVIVKKVNRIKGTIEAKSSEGHSLCIGDNLVVMYPKYWEHLLPEKTTIDAEFDVTVEDKRLLRYGHHCSISHEIEQYGRPKFWGRNCFLFIIGLVLTLMVFFTSYSIPNNFKFSYHYLMNQSTLWKINDLYSLQNASLESGDEIKLILDGGASCEVSRYQTQCQRVYINSTKVELSDLLKDVPDWVEQLNAGNLVITKQDSDTQQLDLYERMISGSNKINFTKLMNADKIVAVVDEICPTDDSFTCHRLKYIFTVLFTDDKNQKIEDWSKLVEYAKNNPQDVIGTSATMREIKAKLLMLGDGFLEKEENTLFELLYAQQQQPNNIVLTYTGGLPLTVVLEPNYSVNSYDAVDRINYYKKILGQSAGKIAVTGMVDKVSYGDHGMIQELVINSEQRYSMIDTILVPEILIETIIFLVVSFFTLLQLVILIFKISANSKRTKQITNSYSNYRY